jgi:hypothetical protein
MRHRMRQAMVGLALVLGLVGGVAAEAGAAPAQTCAQLQAKLNLLQNLYQHVADPEAKNQLLERIEAVIVTMQAKGCFDTATISFDRTMIEL